MPRYIIKLTDKKSKKDFYMEWSTIVDAPVTFGQSLEEFKDYYKGKYGTEGMKELPERLKRVEANGVSSMLGDGVMDIVARNRAGPDETEYSIEEIIENYCINQNA